MAISAGQFRHRIDIEQRVETQDQNTGAVTTTWQVLHTDVPASIVDSSIRELIAAQAVQSKLTTRVVIRRRDGLDASMRIVCKCKCHQGRIFNPEGWMNDNETGMQYLTAPCSEGVNDG